MGLSSYHAGVSHPGPRAVEIVLSGAERRALERAVDGGSGRLAGRAGIVLACAEGLPNTAVAQRFSVSVSTVGVWRSRFAADRMAGLQDERRVGRPKAELVLTDAERAELNRWARRAKTAQYLAMRARIVLACAEGTANKQVAADLGVSVSAVNRWRSPVRRLPPGRPAGRAAPGPAAVDPARSGRGRRRGDLGGGCRRTPPTGRGPRWPSAAA